MPTKPFDLHTRTLLFAKDIRAFLRKLPRSLSQGNDCLQLLRSSGSIGANYIEASDSLGARNGMMHLKISRKEARESHYWLSLLQENIPKEMEPSRSELQAESRELILILSAMLHKGSS